MNNIDKLIDQGYEDLVVFSNYSYDSAIIGVSHDDRVIYSYNKMVEFLMETGDFDEEQAIEWIEYNTIRALPYMGEASPIILYPLDEEDM